MNAIHESTNCIKKGELMLPFFYLKIGLLVTDAVIYSLSSRLIYAERIKVNVVCLKHAQFGNAI